MKQKIYLNKMSPLSGKTVLFRVDYRGMLGDGHFPRVFRRIALKETQTLDDLNNAIIYQSFKWGDPHMYSYFFDNKPFSQNREMEYSCDPEEEIDRRKPNSTKTKIMNLHLKEKQKFLLIFDFGDEHHFSITVEGFDSIDKGKKYPLIMEEGGKAPEQYPPEDDV